MSGQGSRPMRVLVTGGCGFIGSHLVDRHVAIGDDVVIVDDLSTGARANIGHHPAGSVTLHEGRVEDRAVLDAALDGVDLIYHLAAAVGVFEIIRRPIEALQTNLRATDLLFERAAERGIRTIFTSTSEVYGKNDGGPLSENDDSIFGSTSVSRWGYAISKAADEMLALAYFRERGFPVTVVRLFNTTGPRQSGSYGMVVPRFVKQALAGEPLTIFGDGSQSRCFTNVFDVVDALTDLVPRPASVGLIVNVGNARETSIAALAELVRDICGSDSEIQRIPYSQAYGAGFEDMRRRVPDLARLRSLTERVPETPLETTIGQIVEEHRARAAIAERSPELADQPSS